eukprot:1004742-Pelagomonas_calceolata.AAC.1
MLDRLDLYARRKHLVVNTAKSEVVHFNSSRSNLPVFSIAGVPLASKESLKYLGPAYRTWQFVCEHTLGDRPHVPLWLGKHT